MEPAINWSRIAGILLVVIQFANIGLVYLGHFLSPDIALGVTGVIAALQAFTARIQGAPSK